MTKLLITAIIIMFYVWPVHGQEFESVRDIPDQEIKQWVTELKSLYTPQETVCVLGAAFGFSGVKLVDGKLTLHYSYIEGGLKCEFFGPGRMIEFKADSIK